MKLLILSPPLRPRPRKLLEKELERNGLGSDYICLGDGETILPKLRDYGNVPILGLGKAICLQLLGVRDFTKARGFIWTLPEVPEKKLQAARRKAGILPSRHPLPPTQKDFQAWEALEAKDAIKGRKVIATLEPGEALRNDTQYPIFREDVKRACRLAKGEIVGLEDAGTHEVGGPELLEGLGPIVACDIETDGIDLQTTNILCVGVADGARVIVLAPWEHAWAKPLQEFLRSRAQVCFHNAWGFDIPVLERHGVCLA